MIERTELSAEHAELDVLAERLIRQVTQPGGPDSDLASIRWRLNHVLMVHLAKEDRHLYPQLQNCGEARVQALAKRFADEMGNLAEVYLAYTNEWTAQKIAGDARGFSTATLSVMRALRQRILREERDLYPMIGIANRDAMPSPPAERPQPIISASMAP